MPDESGIMFSKFLIAALAASASAIELTPETWSEKTAGKTVFVKFFAPWCGHCKAMKPAWDSLMQEYESSETILIADVDCIGAGKKLCEENGVQGFPTVKYGDPSALEDYKGARDLDSLKVFAGDLKPVCNVGTFENCDDAQTEAIKELKSDSIENLEKKVEDYNAQKAKIEKTFQDGVGDLQAKYQSLSQTKDDDLASLSKESNVGIIRSVIAHKKSTKDEL